MNHFQTFNKVVGRLPSESDLKKIVNTYTESTIKEDTFNQTIDDMDIEEKDLHKIFKEIKKENSKKYEKTMNIIVFSFCAIVFVFLVLAIMGRPRNNKENIKEQKDKEPIQIKIKEE